MVEQALAAAPVDDGRCHAFVFLMAIGARLLFNACMVADAATLPCADLGVARDAARVVMLSRDHVAFGAVRDAVDVFVGTRQCPG